MQFDDDRVDTSRVNDQRDGRGGTMRGGGGSGMNSAAMAGILAMLLRGKGGKGVMGLVVMAVLVMLMTSQCGGLSAFSGAAPQAAAPQGGASDLETRCNTPGAITQYPDCLLAKSFNENDEVWRAEFARLGVEYRPPQLTFFDGSVQTACGAASTAVGPFYCPGDETIYFDLGFADELANLGVNGDYANVYIMSHEFGHHLQNVTGIERQVRQAQQRAPSSANQYGVKMELQADCLAGAWGRMADDRGHVAVTDAEVRQAMAAAAAVGDDRIQQRSGQRVNPESWTHGSAAQREQWYTVGFNTGDLNRCTTFA